MELYLFLIMMGLHVFALWPVTLFYCRSKKKRRPRVVGKSCESLLIDKKGGSRSVIKSVIPVKKLTTPSKMLRPKPSEKKDESNQKKKSEKSEEKIELKKTATTADTEKEKSNPKNAKPPNVDSKPSPKQEQSPKKPDSKPNEAGKKKEKGTDKTQELTENDTQLSNEPGGRSEKTQSQTEQENLEHDTE